MNLTHEKTSIYNNIFTCYVENGGIFQTDYIGNKIGQLGVTNETYSALNSKYIDLKKICDTYYNKLVDAGIIEKEKTPEEIIKEQSELMNQMLLQMKDMQNEINQLKEKKDVQCDESSSSLGKSCGLNQEQQKKLQSAVTKAQEIMGKNQNPLDALKEAGVQTNFVNKIIENLDSPKANIVMNVLGLDKGEVASNLQTIAGSATPPQSSSGIVRDDDLEKYKRALTRL